MSNQSRLRLVVAGAAATIGAVSYVFSPLSIQKSRHVVDDILISTSLSAQEVFKYLRDPINWLDLTPDSMYTVLDMHPFSNGVEYAIHHQISKYEATVTKYKRYWDDSDLVFHDEFLIMDAPFKVRLRVTQDGVKLVKVQVEIELEASMGLRAFFGFVSPDQVETRLQTLKVRLETEEDGSTD
jgi:hypothetical protein